MGVLNLDDVRVEHISKAFSGVDALKDVSIGFSMGEIHALMGANGAGKSTMMNILSGSLRADKGDIILFGEKTHFAGIREAEALGIVMIHQELNLMDDLTVAQNIYIGREPKK